MLATITRYRFLIPRIPVDLRTSDTSRQACNYMLVKRAGRSSQKGSTDLYTLVRGYIAHSGCLRSRTYPKGPHPAGSCWHISDVYTSPRAAGVNCPSSADVHGHVIDASIICRI